MKSQRTLALSLASAGGFLLVAACSRASAPVAPDAPDGGGDDTAVAISDTSVDAGMDVDAGPAQTFVRFAELSPDAPPIDFCLALHGTTSFAGPVLAQLENDAGLQVDGSAPGLSYPQVSTYLALAPGHYDIRVVPGGAGSCSTVADDGGGDGGSDGGSAVIHVADATQLPPMGAEAYTTILAVGDVSSSGKDASFRLTAIVDDATYSTAASGGSALRAVNALPSVPAVDFGFGSFTDGGWLPLFVDVAFGGASLHAGAAQGVVDTQGFLPIGVVDGQELSARPSTAATGDTAVAHEASIGSGSIATLVAIGGKTGDGAHPPALMLCVDNSASGGLLADCSVLR